MVDQQTSSDARTLGQLVAQASDHIRTLLRYEVALAKAEVKASATKGGVGVGLLVGAGVFAFLALVLLLFAAVYGLVALGLTKWGGFLVVAGVLLLLAAILGAVGASRLKKVKGPERAIATTKDTVAAVKGQAPASTGGAGSGR